MTESISKVKVSGIEMIDRVRALEAELERAHAEATALRESLESFITALARATLDILQPVAENGSKE